MLVLFPSFFAVQSVPLTFSFFYSSISTITTIYYILVAIGLRSSTFVKVQGLHSSFKGNDSLLIISVLGFAKVQSLHFSFKSDDSLLIISVLGSVKVQSLPSSTKANDSLMELSVFSFKYARTRLQFSSLLLEVSALQNKGKK